MFSLGIANQRSPDMMAISTDATEMARAAAAIAGLRSGEGEGEGEPVGNSRP
jgi:hypothetical protein